MNLSAFLTLEMVMRLVSMAVFVGIILYVYAPQRRKSMQACALNVLNNDQQPAPTMARENMNGDKHG